MDFIHVTSWDILQTLAVLYTLNMVVLLVWTFLSPLEWNRIFRDSTDMFDRPFESYGICSNSDALPYVAVILVLDISILIAANWWAYQSRNIETEYHESRYVGISMASILQAWCMGIPILIVVWDNPQAKFFVQAGIVFVTALAVLLLIFVPKMLSIHNDRVKAAEESKRIAYTNFTARSRRNQFEDDDADGANNNNNNNNSNVNALNNSPRPGGIVMDGKMSRDTSDSSPDTSTGIAKSSEPDDMNRPREEASPSTLSAIDKVPMSGADEPDNVMIRNSISHTMRSLQEQNNGGGGSGNKTSMASTASDLEPAPQGTPVSSEVEVEGLRVTHNPRAEHNLRVCGGVEYSRAQMEQLEQMNLEQKEQVYLEEDDEDGVPASQDAAEQGTLGAAL